MNLSCKEGVQAVLDAARARFTESVDVAVVLGVNAKKSDQTVRGSSVLPHGLGKVCRVAVFAEADQAQEARDAGADLVGFTDLAEAIQGGALDFDVLIATPGSMRVVGALGPILGPRGLMPNPKVGTVTDRVGTAVKKAKAGQVRYRTDKYGLIHSSIGRVSFTVEQLQENLQTLLRDLQKAKPSTAKGVYFKKIVLSSTMGPGIALDPASCL